MGILSSLFGSRPNPQPQKKKFKLRPEEIVTLIPSMGGGMISDQIAVEGLPVGYMCRQAPNHAADSGWTFMSGRESQAYADDPKNWTMCDLNTIANFDRAVVPYLGLPIGTRLDRVAGTPDFHPVEKEA